MDFIMQNPNLISNYSWGEELCREEPILNSFNINKLGFQRKTRKARQNDYEYMGVLCDEIERSIGGIVKNQTTA